MDRCWQRTGIACAMLVTLVLLFLVPSTAAAQDTPAAPAPAAPPDPCFAEIFKALTGPRLFVSVELRAPKAGAPEQRIFTVLDQGSFTANVCQPGKACDYVFVSHNEKALPTAKIEGKLPKTAKVSTGQCVASAAHTATYSQVPEMTSAPCEASSSSAPELKNADVVVFVADKSAYVRVVRSGACNNTSGCSNAYVATDADVMLPGTAASLPNVCGGKARYALYAPAGSGAAGGSQEEEDRSMSAGKRQQMVLDSYRKATVNSADRGLTIPGIGAEVGAASEASAVAGEVLQILGQIVVDRATEAAYQRAREEIERQLACPDAKSSLGLPDMKLGTKIKFSRTCRVVQSLRIQDLAMSRQALLQALLQDILQAVRLSIVNSGGAIVISDKLVTAFALVLDDLLPELSRVAAGGNSAATSTLLWQLAQDGLSHSGLAIENCTDDACRTVALAAVAIVQCRLEALDKKVKIRERAAVLAGCLVEDHVDTFATKGDGTTSFTPVVIATAKTIASEWMGAQTAVTSSGAPDYRARARYALNAAFDVGCLWLEPAHLKDAKCPAELGSGEVPKSADKIGLARRVVSLARLMIVAAIDGDTNTVIGGLNVGVDLVIAQVGDSTLGKEEKKALHKALRLLGAVLQYAETFTPASGKEDTAALHERRTKILESLTREMTDRTAREDDAIWSLGGSLRATLGARLDPNGQSPTPFGPISLSLGIGFQSAERHHFHFELGIFDLGQYVSYQNSSTGLKVREPEPADVFAPSLTVGAYWNKSFPVFVGITGGYAPQFKFAEDAKKNAGSINIGITAGFYVPLFDIN